MIPEREVVKAIADNRLRPAEAARALWMGRNSMLYRVQQIKKKTGLDPTDFWDMQKLVKEYDITEGEK